MFYLSVFKNKREKQNLCKCKYGWQWCTLSRWEYAPDDSFLIAIQLVCTVIPSLLFVYQWLNQSRRFHHSNECGVRLFVILTGWTFRRLLYITALAFLFPKPWQHSAARLQGYITIIHEINTALSWAKKAFSYRLSRGAPGAYRYNMGPKTDTCVTPNRGWANYRHRSASKATLCRKSS